METFFCRIIPTYKLYNDKWYVLGFFYFSGGRSVCYFLNGIIHKMAPWAWVEIFTQKVGADLSEQLKTEMKALEERVEKPFDRISMLKQGKRILHQELLNRNNKKTMNKHESLYWEFSLKKLINVCMICKYKDIQICTTICE